MPIVQKIMELAKARPMRIILAEGDEERTMKAAARIAAEGIAKLTLLGSAAKIKASGFKMNGADIIDPQDSNLAEGFANEFYELRKAKGMTPEKAKATMRDPLYFGTMMIYKGYADGMVAGAVHSTGDVLRPPLQIIKMMPGIKTVSSSFIMELDNPLCDNGLLVFGDCAVNINPTAEELASIAISTAETAKALAGLAPRVAMLSFSTKGSGKHELVDKVTEATELVRAQAPDLMVDGELQADAALVASVGQLKSPGSPVAGSANVLIFPDLQSGNIGYKLVQRLAGAEALGPIIQGLKKPVNDLSRGCSVEDIVAVAAITAVQAQNMQ